MGSKLSLRSFRENFTQTPRTLKISWESAPTLCLFLAALTLLGAVLPLGVAYIGKLIVDAVVAGSRELTLRYVLCELGLIIFQALVIRGLGLSRQLLGARLSVDINMKILRKAQELELRHFEDPTFYDQLTRARREASSRPLLVVSDTFQLIQNTLTLLGYMALLLAYNPWVAGGLLIASLPAAFSEVHFSSAAFRLRNWRSPEARLLNYIEYVLTTDSHAKEVKAFGLGRLLLERYRTMAETIFREDRALSIRRASWAYALSLIGTVAFYACYGVMALAAAAKLMTLGSLTLYVMAFRQGQQAFQSVLQAIGGMYENNLYMTNLFAYFDIAVSAPRAPLSAALAPSLESERGIRFVALGFRYPGQEGWALRNINLFVPHGQSLALVGHNGAGKTTLIKLLTRLYDPTEGKILLDGRDLREWDLDELRGRMAVVFQDFNRYHFSFEDNVRFGGVDQKPDEEKMLRAVERGGASEVLASLVQGLKTPLGRWFDKGTELSGGQWQKVALARGFIREEADILVLDEPTSALDAEAEFAVFERFRQLTKGRTSFLISHRFPTIRMADKIVVIEGGSIVESGSHTELLASGGRYAELFALQARGYR
ncbi:MAG: ABC transporter ATP-binding protein [Bdellovibrionota bacterium]